MRGDHATLDFYNTLLEGKMSVMLVTHNLDVGRKMGDALDLIARHNHAS